MNFKCALFGHDIRPGLVESEQWIQVKKCIRCGRGFGKILCKGFSDLCWPGATEEEQISWKRYCLDKQEKARRELILD
jgi:hypothetical protein